MHDIAHGVDERERAHRLVRRDVAINVSDAVLPGTFRSSTNARGLILAARVPAPSGAGIRLAYLTERLARRGFAVVMLDLLSPAEVDRRDGRVDVGSLTRRLATSLRWVRRTLAVDELPVGVAGTGLGAAAALDLASQEGPHLEALVCLAGDVSLAREPGRVLAPTLLLVGSLDRDTHAGNRRTARALSCVHEVVVVPGAGHLFGERGTLDRAADLTVAWFARHLQPPPTAG